MQISSGSLPNPLTPQRLLLPSKGRPGDSAITYPSSFPMRLQKDQSGETRNRDSTGQETQREKQSRLQTTLRTSRYPLTPLSSFLLRPELSAMG